MPRLLSRLPLSPRAIRRVHAFAIVAFACVAVVSWWQVATEGATAARVIGAVFSTIVVVIEVLFPGRKRFLRRRVSTAGSVGASQVHEKTSKEMEESD